ncbi:putative histidine kinase/response regulator fusion protein [Halobacteriovorax marinus SJ]|uniref:Sensory/regulatory protein RpfC n=1 Tax=Halobacteriovorax marinus (strain ATCC BAA-682 / DSM 15412 / SJ) TaxID=862908 RepID=E1WY84_HALMS|nr:ATP-binding protein [Halobacteriovorax marinus]CBW27639.1 putative histidine kinase/response regulator fusion protein [Halobacteriovorax marinus SJ]
MKNYQQRLMIVPLLICIFLSSVAIFQYIKIDNIRQEWSQYLNTVDSKGLLYGELKDTLGFGGAHHAFKNYILRGDERYSKVASDSLEKALNILKELEKNPTITPEEFIHIQNIYSTVQKYKDNISVARKLRDQGYSIRRIDENVKVDDDPAIEAFEWLKNNQATLKVEATNRINGAENDAKVALLTGLLFSTIFIFALTYYTSVKLVEAKIKAESVANLKSNFLANMSHEIRTPLNGIIGFTGILSDLKLSTEAKEQVRYIKECGESLAAIINDILDFSKISAGKLSIVKSNFNIRNCVLSTIHIFDHITTSRGIDLKIDIESDIPDILSGDSLRLKQVLTNLIGNAVKFTEKGSIEVKVKVVQKSDSYFKLQFKVKDTGIGIRQEAQARLFYSFEQADVSTSRKYGGTGLGLSISKKLVEAMGGEISVSSEEGVGSEFSFTVMTYTSEEEVPTESKKVEKNSKGSYGDFKILVAEDNKVNQLLVKKLLQKLGYTNFKIVDNGKLAIEALNEEDFHLILMDIQMPVMDGYEAARTIIKYWKDEKRPFIYALSANVMEEDKQKAREIGFDGYIQKPIDVDEFSQVLERHQDVKA